ncbi:hypothetical protein EGW08_004781 [Elysia chlorotica]|uniref:Heme-binding protein 2 n=1 Tax=Elysia chlorotica TaxID=188477 RepID=A0A433U0Z9_ELYCH|nr:hypothetical protein EGW08_004781 [Elysia chlorotica]
MTGKSLITLALVAASLVAAQGMSKPSFCMRYDCPAFDTQRLNGYELRSYGETKWVVTSAIGSTSGMFSKLFRYISGANSERQRIKMTAPVATKVQSVGGNQFRYTMMFYVPGDNPPTPTDSSVEIITLPARDVYVRTFYTWFFMASQSQYESEADELRSALDNNDAAFDLTSYYQISYSSPYWPLRKHQEIWLDRN